jgi:DDE superfamily endonuclease/Helix-turn-helix of DDE superfamily endonuclease
VLAYLRKGDPLTELAAGFRISTATAWRYVSETVALHRKHGMNLQVIASPDGDIVWVSEPLPGAVHNLTAARIWGIVQALAASGLITLSDKGYHGAGEPVLTPYRGKNKPESQKQANRTQARLRSSGERANAQLKTWRILRKLRCCPCITVAVSR